jgi:hypothetical protein
MILDVFFAIPDYTTACCNGKRTVLRHEEAAAAGNGPRHSSFSDITPSVSMVLYVGCIAGASQVEDYEKYLREAGLGGKFLEPLCSMTHMNLFSDQNCGPKM